MYHFAGEQIPSIIQAGLAARDTACSPAWTSAPPDPEAVIVPSHPLEIAFGRCR
jgi:hypothetical protein